MQTSDACLHRDEYVVNIVIHHVNYQYDCAILDQDTDIPRNMPSHVVDLRRVLFE